MESRCAGNSFRPFHGIKLPAKPGTDENHKLNIAGILLTHDPVNCCHRFFELFFFQQVRQVTRAIEPDQGKVSEQCWQFTLRFCLPESLAHGIVNPVPEQVPVFGMFDGGLDLAATVEERNLCASFGLSTENNHGRGPNE